MVPMVALRERKTMTELWKEFELRPLMHLKSSRRAGQKSATSSILCGVGGLHLQNLRLTSTHALAETSSGFPVVTRECVCY